MRAKRCTKCKWFRKSRGKVKCGKDLLDDMIYELSNGEQNDKQKKL